MSLTTDTTGKEFGLLVSLCNNGDFEEARKEADRLIAGGAGKPMICSACYEVMEIYKRIDMKKAKSMAQAFQEYGFHYWLQD